MAPRVYIRSIDREYPALRSPLPRARQPFRHAKFGRSCAIDVGELLPLSFARTRRDEPSCSSKRRRVIVRRILAIQRSVPTHEIVKLLRTSSARHRKRGQCNARLSNLFFGSSSDIVARYIGSVNLLALWMDDFLITTRPWIFMRLMGNGKRESGKFHSTQMIRRSICNIEGSAFCNIRWAKQFLIIWRKM